MTSFWALGLYFPEFQDEETVLTPFLGAVDHWFYTLLNNKHMILIQAARCTDDTKEHFLRLCLIQRNCTGKDSIALVALSANFKDTFDNCDICEGSAVRMLAYLLSYGTKEVYEAYNAKKMSINAKFGMKFGQWPSTLSFNAS